MDNASQPISLGRKIALGGATLLAAAVIVFVVQNSESVDVEWFGLTMQAPLFLVMILSGVTALGLRKLISWGLRRRTRTAERRNEEPRDA